MNDRLESSAPDVIARKRDGKELSEDEIRAIITGFTRGSVPDYQITAFAMAVYFQGMTFGETVALTAAMRDSGKILRFPESGGPVVDKHSTGGVGDKVTICLAPMIAACGGRVPTMSGRGLGHTGGTLDKLEAIPGFRVALSTAELKSQIRRIGCALIGQTGDLAPADRRLYALRDVTATVESIPLITASILSKKLAAGIDNLVLDVKSGRGAFMKTPSQARQLAKSLVKVGRLAGKNVSAVMTDMNTPLGLTIGNAIETIEALELLHGDGPEDVREVTFALGVEMLRSSGIARTPAEATRKLETVIHNGDALEKMRELVEAQGGDVRVVDEPDRLRLGKYRRTIKAPRTGYIRDLDALALGRASMGLGAGRTRAEDPVDPAAGIRLHAKKGDHVKKGAPLATLYTSKASRLRQVEAQAVESFVLGGAKPRSRHRVIETLRR